MVIGRELCFYLQRNMKVVSHTDDFIQFPPISAVPIPIVLQPVCEEKGVGPETEHEDDDDELLGGH